jgi:hypothetical protein
LYKGSTPLATLAAGKHSGFALNSNVVSVKYSFGDFGFGNHLICALEAILAVVHHQDHLDKFVILLPKDVHPMEAHESIRLGELYRDLNSKGALLVKGASDVVGDECAREPHAKELMLVGAVNEQRVLIAGGGDCVSVYAPGDLVRASYRVQDLVYPSGTQFAAAYVAGAAAVYMGSGGSTNQTREQLMNGFRSKEMKGIPKGLRVNSNQLYLHIQGISRSIGRQIK